MSAAKTAEINRRLRAAGIFVHEYPGAASRGNGQVSDYQGGIIHHTATAFGIALPGSGVGNLLANGRPDLSGPLANYAGNSDGSITFIAANPANHAGASGGRSMGPLPVSKSFNRLVLGLEIVYPGTQPMNGAQYRTALIWARIVADVVGRGDIQRIRAHAETSITGKWDPGWATNKTIDMGRFRAEANSVLAGQPQVPPNVDKELKMGALSPIPLERGAGTHTVTLPVEVGSNSSLVGRLWVGLISGFDGLKNVEVIFPMAGRKYATAPEGNAPMKFPDLPTDERVFWEIPNGAVAVSLVYTCKSDGSRPGICFAEQHK